MPTGEVDGRHLAGGVGRRGGDGRDAPDGLPHQQRAAGIDVGLARHEVAHGQDLPGGGQQGEAEARHVAGHAVLRVARGGQFAIAQAQRHRDGKALADEEAGRGLVAGPFVFGALVAVAAVADDDQREGPRAGRPEGGDHQLAFDGLAEGVLDARRHAHDGLAQVGVQALGLVRMGEQGGSRRKAGQQATCQVTQAHSAASACSGRLSITSGTRRTWCRGWARSARRSGPAQARGGCRRGRSRRRPTAAPRRSRGGPGPRTAGGSAP
mmetsp:Transcript_4829/g.17066  ORF Transcript_4829/g.17066 Transcript_4829/m.17066 type:complete len:267 (+) Transcript_4829:515-1315(+)